MKKLMVSFLGILVSLAFPVMAAEKPDLGTPESLLGSVVQILKGRNITDVSVGIEPYDNKYEVRTTVVYDGALSTEEVLHPFGKVNAMRFYNLLKDEFNLSLKSSTPYFSETIGQKVLKQIDEVIAQLSKE